MNAIVGVSLAVALASTAGTVTGHADAAPASGPSSEGRAYSLQTVPRKVYKVADPLDTTEPSEVWYFHVVVPDSTSRLRPLSAEIQLFSRTRLIKSMKLGPEALEACRRVTFRKWDGLNEAFDLRHHFREPQSLAIDRVKYDLELGDSLGHSVHEPADVLLLEYTQQARLVFPVSGNFVVTNGNISEGGHHEWSQHYAYDIIPLGPEFQWVRPGGDGTRNEDFVGWGREIVAPGEGTVTYARNDVPDNPSPGATDMDAILAMPEPEWAVAGNVVVIDHGHGEFSCFGHMRKGSVRVKRGDHVKRGQVVGLLGNSGHSQGPHVHYHLMDGPLLFKSDGLPSTFENVEGGRPVQGMPSEAK